MSKYYIVIYLALGLTIILNAYATIRTSSSGVKTVWANIFMLVGMMLFFEGMREVMVKFINYLPQAIASAIFISKQRF
jgi:F0F1-type ATP synthase membrane subunit c/vacuolar-type H+-ATPase subunit K